MVVVRLGPLLIGLILVVGGWSFSDFTIMWFASPDAYMAQWRQLLVLALFMHIIVRANYDNEYLHVLRGLMAVCLFWGGVDYSINHSSYVFDTVFIVGASISFAVDALQKIPVETSADCRRPVRTTHDKLLAVVQMRRFIDTAPTFILLHRNAIRDDSHILSIGKGNLTV